MTALDIISQVRERLGDINEQRWTNKRMLSIVSQGQQDICKVTNYLRRVTYIPLKAGTTKYLLPPDCITVKRLEYQGSPMPMYSRGADLQSSYLVAYKSNLNIGSIEFSSHLPDLTKLRSYTSDNYELTSVNIAPIYGVVSYIEETDDDTIPTVVDPEYGVTTDAVMDYSRDRYSHFGEITDFTYEPDKLNGSWVVPKYGVAVLAGFNLLPNNRHLGFTTEAKGHIVSGMYGLVTSGAVEAETVKVYYVALPHKVTTLYSALLLPDVWEDLLLRYVVGTALQDDNDANNIQRGETELKKYTTQLMKLRELSTKDFATHSNERLHTTFRRV